MSNNLKIYEEMFTKYANPEFSKINGKDNKVFKIYGMYNDCYSYEQVEWILDRNFCDYLCNYRLNKLTKNQKCNLKRDFEMLFKHALETAKNNKPTLLGNENERDRFIIEFLDECEYCSEKMVGYLNWKEVVNDFSDDLGIVEFDEQFYLVPELLS